jgi:uncharacterized membrane protein
MLLSPANLARVSATPSLPARNAANLGLLLIALLGVAFAAIVPPFQVADEHAHFIRAYEIARGHWIGVSQPVLPEDVIALVRRYPEKLEWVKKLNPDSQASDLFSPVGGHYWLPRGIIAANVYCPVAYIPASTAIALGRLFGLPPLGLFYAARVAGVLLLVAASWLAFRLAPEYWHTIAAVALLPTTLHQTGGVSADVMTIGVSFVVVACLLWLRQHVAGSRAMLWTALAFVLLVLCKVSPWAFAALLLIHPKAFASRRAWIAYIAVVALAMIAAISAWQTLSRGNVDAFIASRQADGIDMAARTHYIATHFVTFACTAGAYCVRHLPRYLVMFVGGFAWTRFHLPLWVQPVCLLMLVIVAATEAASKPFSRVERLLWASVFAISVAFLHTVLYISDGMDGIQGRYFIPFCLFGLLALRQSRIVLPRLFLTRLVIGFGLAHGIFALIWLWGAFYV